MSRFDVAIVGAGPAGAALAAVLAPRHDVVLIDRLPEPAPRIGESLIPAARRLLRDMRLLEAFEADDHPAYLGNRSVWDAEFIETDFLRQADGSGWHLDRRQFERFLRSAAAQRGASLKFSRQLTAVTRDGDCWRLDLKGDGTAEQLSTRLLVDAGGRAAPVARRLNIGRVELDRLISCWTRGSVQGENAETAGFSYVESEPSGWWYSAPLAGRPDQPRSRVVAFHTDHDLTSSIPQSAGEFLDRAMRLPELGRQLRQTGFSMNDAMHRVAAGSSHLQTAAGADWLAVGDAALSFDPLSSRGLFNALYTAMTAAMCCHERLTGDIANFSEYSTHLATLQATTAADLLRMYQAESRWPEQPFWQRRSGV